jgi:hypothetical protein
VKDKECPIDKGGRVKMGDHAAYVRTIDTHYNDVDINGHINSVKYIEHLLDLWPLSWYNSHTVKRFEIAYVAEAHGGDRLAFYREEQTKAGSGQKEAVEGRTLAAEPCCKSDEHEQAEERDIELTTKEYNIRVLKAADCGKEESGASTTEAVEVCRSRIVFG